MKRFTADDRLEFTKVLAALGTTFRVEITPELLRAYELALCDVPIKGLKQKALKCMREGQWFPRPAELRPSRYRQEWQRKAKQTHEQLADDRRTQLAWRQSAPLQIGQILGSLTDAEK